LSLGDLPDVLGRLPILIRHVTLLSLSGLAIPLGVVLTMAFSIVLAALLLLVFVPLSGILRIGLLSRLLFGIHRSPFWFELDSFDARRHC
jgi:hypothetical protein